MLCYITLPTCGPLPILPPALKRWGLPRRQGYVASLPTSGPLLILPLLLSGADPQGGRGFVATCPICGPLLILPPALKGWGHPRWHGLCSHIAHLWANSNYAPRSGGDPLGGRVYVATLPTCGPLLILPPALKRWGSPGRQGLCSHLTHLWVTYDCAPL